MDFCCKKLHFRCRTAPRSFSVPYGRCPRVLKIIEEIRELTEIRKFSPKHAYKLHPLIYILCTKTTYYITPRWSKSLVDKAC